MTPDFTIAGYERLILAFLNRGYMVCDYVRAEVGKPHLILRHDIDMSLEAALHLSRIEKDLGVRAFYFVLLRTEFYNPLSSSGLRMINRLMEDGHEIGLHFDASICAPGDIDEIAAMECDILERVIKKPIEMISFHRPAKCLLGRQENVAGRRHTYEPAFFENIGYVSDSRGAWHYGHPIDHPAVQKAEALQLLTHPLWWGDPAARPGDKLDRFLRDRMHILDDSLARECEVHFSDRAQLNFD